MVLKMKGFDNKKWLFAVSLLLLYISGYSQMVLKFDLNGTGVNAGNIKIGEYGLESTRVFYSKDFSGKRIQCNLELPDSTFSKNAILKWNITGDSNQNYVSFFMALKNDTILFIPADMRVVYSQAHPLFKFTELSNSFNGTQSSKELIIDELIRLYKLNKFNNYVEFVFFNAIKNGLIHKEELSAYKLQFDETSTWGSQILKLLNEKPALNINIIDDFCAKNRFALIKFWATWCKPCLTDNEILNDLYYSDSLKLSVLGIQVDDGKKEMSLFYDNIIDENGYLTKKYSVTAFPTYLLFENNKLVLRTGSLAEILAYVKKKVQNDK